MTGCPSIEILERLLDGSLPEPASASVREHLDDCPQCLSELDRLSEDDELREWKDCPSEAVRQLRREAGCVRLLGRMRSSSTMDPAAFETKDDRGPDLELAPAIHAGDIGVLGPYRIIRELGRGGMGIVLEAFDTELRRDAAIKVLRPDRADEKSRARFVREAQAAARVKHTHVVTVHSVANPPAALPYLVMELVRGPTLRERIVSVTRLDPREAARIVAEVADGLAAAHDAGLVHRDIKPSNIMLEDAGVRDLEKGVRNHFFESKVPDTFFRAKVMDFGLARITTLASSLTHDGTLAGTPAYMSPEQVRNPDTIDPRADVYSLGVTLYEALTGEVPFGGAPHMVLRQIETDEPRPPRQLNDAVPRDLETICLKAVEKDITRRYSSAREFADDLRRWLGGEPIAARPVGSPERQWRWCRRNPRVAVLSGTVLGLLTMLAAGSTAGFLRIARAHWETTQQRNAAIAAGKRATDSANDAAESQRLAEERLAVALDSLNDLIFKVQTQLADTSGTLKVREQLLETAMAGLDRITKDAGKLPAADHSIAVAHQRIGDILWLSGRVADARTHYGKCRELAEARLASEPENIAARRDLAAAHEKTGVLDQHGSQFAPAHEHYAKSLEIRLALTAEAPNETELQRDLYAAHSRSGDLDHLTGDNRAALRHYESARQIQTQLLQGEEPDAVPPHDQILTLRRLGWASQGLSRLEEARDFYIEALQLGETLSVADPGNATRQRDVALIQHSIGVLHIQLARFSDAEDSFRKALAIIEQLAAAEPNHAEMQYDLQLEHYWIGIAQRAAGNLIDAKESFHHQLEALDPLARRNPSSLKFRNELYGVYYVLAELELRDGNYEGTADWLDKAIAELRQLETEGQLKDPLAQSSKRFVEHARAACDIAPLTLDNPDVVRSQPSELVPLTLAFRAYELARRGRFADAATTVDEVRGRLGDAASDFERSQCLVSVARTLAVCARVTASASTAGSSDPDPQLSEQYTQKCIAAMREAAQLNPSHLGYYYLEPEFAIVRGVPAYEAMLKELLPK